MRALTSFESSGTETGWRNRLQRPRITAAAGREVSCRKRCSVDFHVDAADGDRELTAVQWSEWSEGVKGPVVTTVVTTLLCRLWRL